MQLTILISVSSEAKEATYLQVQMFNNYMLAVKLGSPFSGFHYHELKVCCSFNIPLNLNQLSIELTRQPVRFLASFV